MKRFFYDIFVLMIIASSFYCGYYFGNINKEKTTYSDLMKMADSYYLMGVINGSHKEKEVMKMMNSKEHTENDIENIMKEKNISIGNLERELKKEEIIIPDAIMIRDLPENQTIKQY